LWQAVQNHDISGKEALIMGLAQRGMNTPYPEQAPAPNVPVAPADPAAPAAPVPPPAPGAPLLPSA
jgi:resuscitation-promoting factor RpfA